MNLRATCQRCRGFVPPTHAECPTCGVPPSQPGPRGSVAMTGLLLFLGAGMAALALMA